MTVAIQKCINHCLQDVTVNHSLDSVVHVHSVHGAFNIKTYTSLWIESNKLLNIVYFMIDLLVIFLWIVFNLLRHMNILDCYFRAHYQHNHIFFGWMAILPELKKYSKCSKMTVWRLLCLTWKWYWTVGNL